MYPWAQVTPALPTLAPSTLPAVQCVLEACLPSLDVILRAGCGSLHALSPALVPTVRQCAAADLQVSWVAGEPLVAPRASTITTTTASQHQPCCQIAPPPLSPWDPQARAVQALLTFARTTEDSGALLRSLRPLTHLLTWCETGGRTTLPLLGGPGARLGDCGWVGGCFENWGQVALWLPFRSPWGRPHVVD